MFLDVFCELARQVVFPSFANCLKTFNSHAYGARQKSELVGPTRQFENEILVFSQNFY